MKIGYLSSHSVLPENPERRADAFEHDLQIECLAPAFAETGFDLCVLQWDEPETEWTEFSAVIIGTVWDYADKCDEFLSTLDKIERCGVPVFNPGELVQWNARKTYLRDLQSKGARCIPTLWPECPASADLQRAFDKLKCDDIVVKRQVGAGAFGQMRLKRGDVLPDYPYPAMIQPFMSPIQTEGEFSFIMIDGELSHALLKRAKAGEYRIQSLYGGFEEKIDPSEKDIAAARAVLETLSTMPLYARVDMIRTDDGALTLMELELIEPYLYPVQADRLGEMFAAAMVRRLRG